MVEDGIPKNTLPREEPSNTSWSETRAANLRRGGIANAAQQREETGKKKDVTT